MALSRPRVTELSWIVRSFKRDSAVRRFIVGFAAFLVIWVVLYGNVLPDRVSLEEGEAAPQDVSVPRETINRLETERLKREALAAVSDVYHQDAKVLDEVLAEVEDTFAKVDKVLKDEDLTQDGKVEALQGIVKDCDPLVLEALPRSAPRDLERIKEEINTAISSLMKSGIKSDALDNFKKQIDLEVQNIPVSQELRIFAAGVAKQVLKPNLIYSASETEARKAAVLEQVQPVKLARGEVIIRKGEKVTPEHIALLEDLGLMESGPDISDLLGSALMSAILVGAVGLYLKFFNGDLLESETKLVLLVLVSLSSLLIGQILQPISGFLAPVAAGTMLIATLLEPRLAVVVGVVLSFVVCSMNGWDMQHFITGVLGGLAGVYGVSRVGHRSDFMRAGFVVSTANVAVIMSTFLIMGISIGEFTAWRALLWGATNGVVCAILTMGSLPCLESLFQVITPMKLIEVSNPNQPLLKKLLTEAPGTYHHSVMVANLAEAATEAVGGDSLLARVGSYYHDVGKAKRPYFFIDNQFGQENPHDKLSPSLSTLIITSHVRDGIEMATEHRVPESIKEFIRTHHGTSLVSFFYNRAAEDERADDPAEADFRYDGPKPGTRETAIVMLADAVEAAVRSVTKATPARIEGVVKRIIRERLNDGQLDKCDLTFRDLDIIGDTFVRMLSGMFHPRIEYPENVLKEMERGRSNGGSISGPSRESPTKR